MFPYTYLASQTYRSLLIIASFCDEQQFYVSSVGWTKAKYTGEHAGTMTITHADRRNVTN